MIWKKSWKCFVIQLFLQLPSNFTPLRRRKLEIWICKEKITDLHNEPNGFKMLPMEFKLAVEFKLECSFLKVKSWILKKKSFKFSKFWLLLSGTAVLLGKAKDKILVFLGDIKEKVMSLPSAFSSTADVQDTATSTPGIYTHSVKACRQIRIRRITRFLWFFFLLWFNISLVPE